MSQEFQTWTKKTSTLFNGGLRSKKSIILFESFSTSFLSLLSVFGSLADMCRIYGVGFVIVRSSINNTSLSMTKPEKRLSLRIVVLHGDLKFDGFQDFLPVKAAVVKVLEDAVIITVVKVLEVAVVGVYVAAVIVIPNV